MRKACKDCGIYEKAQGRSRCWSCYTSYRRGYEEATPQGARVLLLDIETSPNTVYTWGLFNQNIGINQIVESTRMLCFAAKWLGTDETLFFSEWQDGADGMALAAHTLLGEADVVMHFNGKKFDIPHLNREMLQSGLTPPSPFKQIDLCAAVKKMFRFPSNKLQYVSTVLGLDGKDKTDFDLWTGVMGGDPDARAYMEKYNRKDTELMEELYHILLPWIPNLPNNNLYNEGGGCSACGSDDVVAKGEYTTPLSVFPQYKCRSCGYWMRGVKRTRGADMRGAIL